MDQAKVARWIERGRAQAERTRPLDVHERGRVKEAVNETYRRAGAAPPAAVITVASPQAVMREAQSHVSTQSMAQVNAAARLCDAIRVSEAEALGWVGFRGEIARAVDRAVLSPATWGVDLHPRMVSPPGTGNLQPGVAAELGYLLDVPRTTLSANVVRRLRAMINRCLAGPARFLDDIAFVSDMPRRFHRDEEGRPHHPSGPAVAWADGTGINFWHGVRVPDDFFAWTPQRALREINAEVRRCAIERLDTDVLERHLTLVAEAPDPANPPHVLRLYDLPRPWLSGRLLVVDNASLDKGGHRRRFHLFVPPHLTNPVEAVANSFGLTEAEYARLERAT